MKKAYVLFIVILLNHALFSQNADTVKLWTVGGEFSLNFSQVSLVNWAAGGSSSISGATLLNSFANYKKDKITWENGLILGYGLISEAGESTRKSDDRIDLTSKFGYQMGKHWYYTASLNFRSQFAPGFNFPNDSIRISEFLAPGYLVLATGAEYKPFDFFSISLSPLTGKFTFVTNQTLANAGAFGVEGAIMDNNGNVLVEGSRIRSEIGASFQINFQKDVAKNVNLFTRLNLFSNYSENPENIDINWEVIWTFKVNKFLNTNLSTQLLYDDDINFIDENGVESGPRVQFKEVFNLGFSVKF